MTAPQPWPTTRLCPATSNLPTRMLAASWQALCAAMQRREAVGARRNGRGLAMVEDFKAISAARFPCATCGGRMLPPGLELITTKEAIEMARQTKRGICELCGAHTNVGMNHGSAACPACTHVQTALNKRPEAVAKAIRAMGKTEELLGHLIPAGGLAVKVTADLLQEISGIVEYKGEDPAELVAAVRKRVLTCASCEAEDVLHEIREIVGYVPEQGDKGLAEAVRAFEDRRPADAPDCAECDAAAALLEIAELVGKRGASSGLVVEAVRESVELAATLSATGDFLRDDLMRACGMDLNATEDGDGWDVAAAAAIQTIASLTNHGLNLLELLSMERADNASLRNEIARLSGVPDCAECDAAEALLEIAELVGKRGSSSGLVVEAVRMAVIGDPINHCADCTALRGDLLRACGLEMDDTEDGEGWDMAAAAAIHAIAEIEYFYRREAARFLVVLEDEQRKQAVIRNDTARLNGQTHSESEQVTALRSDLSRSSGVIDQLRAEITLLEQSRDEWEQRAVQAESNVETLEAELRNREDAPAAPCASTTYLLDIALRALRGEGPDVDQLATIIDAARRAV